MCEIVTAKTPERTNTAAQLCWHAPDYDITLRVRIGLLRKNLDGPDVGQGAWFGSNPFKQCVTFGRCLTIAFHLSLLEEASGSELCVGSPSEGGI